MDVRSKRTSLSRKGTSNIAAEETDKNEINKNSSNEEATQIVSDKNEETNSTRSTSSTSRRSSKNVCFNTQLSTSSNNSSISCQSSSGINNENIDGLSNDSTSSNSSTSKSSSVKNENSFKTKTDVNSSINFNDNEGNIEQKQNTTENKKTKRKTKNNMNDSVKLDVINEDEISNNSTSTNKSKSIVSIEKIESDAFIPNDETKINEDDLSNSNEDTINQGSGDSNNKTNNENDDSNDPNEPKKKRRRRGSLIAHEQQLNSAEISVTNLFIYPWPLVDENAEQNKNSSNLNPLYDSNESYLLQEQFSEYLGVKSFKRKYPDIFRRLIDIKEREYLKENKVVTETQCDLGLTALKLSECLEIMAIEYPDKYTELTSYLAEKRRKAMNDKKQQLQQSKLDNALPSAGPRPGRPLLTEQEKQREQIKKAMKSASSYNSMLQKEKKEERMSFFDLQTMRIQKPTKKENVNFKISNPNGLYPVSVLQGQYQYHYKRYTSEQLKYMPLNTIIETIPTPLPYLYDEWKKKEEKRALNGDKNVNESSDDEKTYRPPPINNSNLNSTINNNSNLSNRINNILSTNNTTNTIRLTASAAPTVAKLISTINPSQTPNSAVLIKQPSIAIKTSDIAKTCVICSKASSQDTMINCSSCSRSSHPVCLELNPDLVDWQYIKSYEWQCIECKKCSTCNNPHDEDKMMFCDRCDRGFHTYCVGVKEVPLGTWLCKTCSSSVQNASVGRSAINTQNSNYQSPENKVRGRGRPPGSLNKPKDPNSPKKTPKINKMMKSDLNLSGDVNNLIKMDDENDTSYFNQELSFYH